MQLWSVGLPEDCGGAPGYEAFVQAMADPNHEEHAETAEWIGRIDSAVSLPVLTRCLT